MSIFYEDERMKCQSLALLKDPGLGVITSRHSDTDSDSPRVSCMHSHTFWRAQTFKVACTLNTQSTLRDEQQSEQLYLR